MVKLVDTLGLGSNSYESRGSSPLFGKQKLKIICFGIKGKVAQRFRVLACRAKSRGFKSRLFRFYSSTIYILILFYYT